MFRSFLLRLATTQSMAAITWDTSIEPLLLATLILTMRASGATPTKPVMGSLSDAPEAARRLGLQRSMACLVLRGFGRASKGTNWDLERQSAEVDGCRLPSNNLGE